MNHPIHKIIGGPGMALLAGIMGVLVAILAILVLVYRATRTDEIAAEIKGALQRQVRMEDRLKHLDANQRKTEAEVEKMQP